MDVTAVRFKTCLSAGSSKKNRSPFAVMSAAWLDGLTVCSTMSHFTSSVFRVSGRESSVPLATSSAFARSTCETWSRVTTTATRSFSATASGVPQTNVDQAHFPAYAANRCPHFSRATLVPWTLFAVLT